MLHLIIDPSVMPSEVVLTQASCPPRQSGLIGCMSFGVKSLLTPDKVGPREAFGRVSPPRPGLVQMGPLSGSPRVAFLSEMVLN